MSTAKFVVEIYTGNLQMDAYLIDEQFKVIATCKSCKTILYDSTGTVVDVVIDNKEYEELKKNHNYIRNDCPSWGQRNFFMHTSTLSEGIECCKLESSLTTLSKKTTDAIKNLWDSL